MLWPVLALGVALLVPLVTSGSYTRLVEKPWRWGSFLAGGLGIQLALDVLPIPESRWHSVGFGLLVVSYVLLLAFCARNALIRGMAVVFIGIALNAVVITVNQGMPVKVPPDWQRDGTIEATIKHHPREAGDQLLVLSDIILLRRPFDTVLSFGDLILAVGLCDVTYHASRRGRRRGGRRRERDVVIRDDEQPALDIRRDAPLKVDAAERERFDEIVRSAADVDDEIAVDEPAFDDDGERIDHDRVVRVRRS
jgi:hypothetical protein